MEYCFARMLVTLVSRRTVVAACANWPALMRATAPVFGRSSSSMMSLNQSSYVWWMMMKSSSSECDCFPFP